jgi:hypothetical protein
MGFFYIRLHNNTTTDPLSVELIIYFLPDDGRTIETCSNIII